MFAFVRDPRKYKPTPPTDDSDNTMEALVRDPRDFKANFGRQSRHTEDASLADFEDKLLRPQQPTGASTHPQPPPRSAASIFACHEAESNSRPPARVATTTTTAYEGDRRSDLLTPARPMVSGVDKVERELRCLTGLLESGFLSQSEYSLRARSLEQLLPTSSPLHPCHLAGTPSSTSGAAAHVMRSPTTGPTESCVRVFLSSTFVDMQEERDHLIKHVFPVLAAHCASRGLFFYAVDLRWGITADQANSGRTLGLCLSEIDRCRPFFVNMLGSRYGWMPQTIPEDLYTTYPWLKNVALGQTSVTEMEVMHGAINSSNASALFYFRDSRRMPGSVRDSEEEDSIRRVDALKERIRANGFHPRGYSCASRLGECVLEDLTQQIAQIFPAKKTVTQDSVQAGLAADLLAHEMYAGDRRRLYVARDHLLDALDAFVDEPATRKPLVVVGSAGCGKSSLLANWAHRRASRGRVGEVVVEHYVGSSSSSSNVTHMLTRIMRTVKHTFSIAEDITADAQQLVRDFERWMSTLIPPSRSLVLIVDGLDQLTAVDVGSTLTWLPESFPSSARLCVVVSSLSPHSAFDLCTRREYTCLGVPSLTLSERSLLCVEHLRQFGKSLSSAQLNHLVTAPQAGHPLFLRVVLDELRVHGVYEELDALLAQLLCSQSVPSLFQNVLDRLMRDYSADTSARPEGVVRAMLCYLFVSRDGLSEEELLSLLDIPHLVLLPLLTAMHDMLVTQCGLLSLGHEHLRLAIENRFLDSEEAKRKYHCELADFFDFRDDDYGNTDVVYVPTAQRRAHELPHQLLWSGQHYRLSVVLSDLRVFNSLWNKGRKYELKGYWLAIQHRYSASECYSRSLENFLLTHPTNEEGAAQAAALARFLREMLHYGVAEAMLRRSLGLIEAVTDDHPLVAKCCFWLGQVFWNQGLFDEAMPFCTRALAYREKLFGANHIKLTKVLVPMGEMLTPTDPPSAKQALERAKTICEATYGRMHARVSRCLHGLGTLACDKGQHTAALRYHVEAIQIREQVLGPRHPELGVSWEVLGSTYQIMGDNEHAKISFEKALSICTEVHGEETPQVASCCYWLWLVHTALPAQTAIALDYQARYRRIEAVLDKTGKDVRQRIVD